MMVHHNRPNAPSNTQAASLQEQDPPSSFPDQPSIRHPTAIYTLPLSSPSGGGREVTTTTSRPCLFPFITSIVPPSSSSAAESFARNNCPVVRIPFPRREKSAVRCSFFFGGGTQDLAWGIYKGLSGPNASTPPDSSPTTTTTPRAPQQNLAVTGYVKLLPSLQLLLPPSPPKTPFQR